MISLIRDVLIIILEEFKGDRKSLHSCLLVNKTWCEIIVPILWKNPWKYLEEDEKEKSQLDVIISHLSNEIKRDLINKGINTLTGIQRKPLFNYIRFCKYLDLYKLEKIIYTINYVEESILNIIRNEIFKLFINNNMKFTNLRIPGRYNYQIHLIPGAEYCLSELEYLQCHNNSDQNIFEGLAKINKSIKKLEINIEPFNNTGIIKLIESQKNLNNVHLIYIINDESFYNAIEGSLINHHVDTIRHLKISRKHSTRIFSCLVNLVSLEIIPSYNTDWSNLENISLPFLKILKTRWVPSSILASLIENTKGCLIEISVYDKYYEGNNKRLIQSIYQKCLNLKYLKFSIKNNDISEFNKLLIKCQYLDGLFVHDASIEGLNWSKLFEIITKSASNNLFKFKFEFNYYVIKLETFKIFFDNWKGRHPMLLHIPIDGYKSEYFDLINKYKLEGIVKFYDKDLCRCSFDEFEWIRKENC